MPAGRAATLRVRRRAGCRGATYVLFLVLVAVSGALLAGVGGWQTTLTQRDREAELLFIGNEFRQAIHSYYWRSPGGIRRFPRTLDELVADQRFAEPQRHLRRIYRDPFTGRTDWGLVLTPDAQIVGVHSLSTLRPLKIANFRPRDGDLEGKQQYADWKFVYSPASVAIGTSPRPAQPGGLPTPVPRPTRQHTPWDRHSSR